MNDVAEIAVFPGFGQYFGLNIVVSFISALHMTGNNIQSHKFMRKRIGNKKIRKSGNGNVFQNLIKIVVNLFGKKVLLFFMHQTQKSCLVWVSFLHLEFLIYD